MSVKPPVKSTFFMLACLDTLLSKRRSPRDAEHLDGMGDAQPEFVPVVSPPASPPCVKAAVGGQAVMEGIVMRNEENAALAVRRPDGNIVVERRPWLRLGRKNAVPAARRPRFLRGFPLLMETVYNGVNALERSAQLAENDHQAPGPVALGITLAMAVVLALAMFVALPHGLSVLMEHLGWGTDMAGLGFHAWDGVFKLLIFLGYIAAISCLAEIRRVFQYHGAEHKVIGAYEAGGIVCVDSAREHSRLHPRCGTTFLLFVLSLAIVMHALLVPPFLWLWQPEGAFVKHGGILLAKILMMIPISAVAYELIRLADGMQRGFLGRLLRAPGLALQLLTTREPDSEQLEVAVVALREALGDDCAHRFQTPVYTVLE